MYLCIDHGNSCVKAGLFDGDVVSADVSYSMWRYLGAVGLLVSWLASFYLLRQGDDGQGSV